MPFCVAYLLPSRLYVCLFVCLSLCLSLSLAIFALPSSRLFIYPHHLLFNMRIHIYTLSLYIRWYRGEMQTKCVPRR